MTKAEFYQELESILRLKQGEAHADVRLSTLSGWDSLSIIEFISMADESLGLLFDSERLKKCQTLGELEDLCKGSLES